MTMILESPILVVVLGLLATILLCGGWVQTGRSWLLLAAVAAVALTIGGLAIERWVMTDREQVEQLLRTTAANVQKNDAPAVLAALHSSATDLHHLVKFEMDRVVFEEVDIKRNLKIDLQPDHQPPQVVATFNVLARGHFKSGGASDRGISYVTVKFWIENDQWRVSGVEFDDVGQAFRASADDAHEH